MFVLLKEGVPAAHYPPIMTAKMPVSSFHMMLEEVMCT